jgi:hypothetical protein
MGKQYEGSERQKKEKKIIDFSNHKHPMTDEQFQARLQELERDRASRESSKIAHP